MIKRFLQRWLGIQELFDSQTLTRARVDNLYQGDPIYPADDPHDPLIIEKPAVVKGYVAKR